MEKSWQEPTSTQPQIKPKTRKKSEKAKVVAARITTRIKARTKIMEGLSGHMKTLTWWLTPVQGTDVGITTHKAIRLAGRVLGKSYRVHVLATPGTADVGIP